MIHSSYTEDRRADLVIMQKEGNKCHVVDFAVWYDMRVNTRDDHKLSKSGSGNEAAMEYASESGCHYRTTSFSNV